MAFGPSVLDPNRLETCPPLPTLTFIHGFLLGQGFMLIFAILVLKFVVFEDPKVAAQAKRKQALRSLSQAQKKPVSSSTALPLSDSPILKKFGYDLATHAAESADWLNVLLAQIVVGYRSMVYAAGSEGGSGAKMFVEEALNAGKTTDAENPNFVAVDYINVTEVDFGEQFPVLSGIRVRPSEETGRVRIEAELEYSDHCTLGIDTKVLINFPRPRFAIVPMSLSVTLIRFSATLSIEVPPNPTAFPPELLICIHPDFELELTSTSLIGSRAKLQDIPKIEQLIISRIRGWIVDKLVWPRKLNVRLPQIVPEYLSEKHRQKQKREQEQDEQEQFGQDTLPEDDYVWVQSDEGVNEDEEDYEDEQEDNDNEGDDYRNYARQRQEQNAQELDPDFDISIDDLAGLAAQPFREIPRPRSRPPPPSSTASSVQQQQRQHPLYNTTLYNQQQQRQQLPQQQQQFKNYRTQTPPPPPAHQHAQSSSIPISVSATSTPEKSVPGHLPRDDSVVYVDGGDLSDFESRRRRSTQYLNANKSNSSNENKNGNTNTNASSMSDSTANNMRRRSYQQRDSRQQPTHQHRHHRPTPSSSSSSSSAPFNFPQNHYSLSSGPSSLAGPFDHIRQRTSTTSSSVSGSAGGDGNNNGRLSQSFPIH